MLRDPSIKYWTLLRTSMCVDANFYKHTHIHVYVYNCLCMCLCVCVRERQRKRGSRRRKEKEKGRERKQNGKAYVTKRRKDKRTTIRNRIFQK